MGICFHFQTCNMCLYAIHMLLPNPVDTELEAGGYCKVSKLLQIFLADKRTFLLCTSFQW